MDPEELAKFAAAVDKLQQDPALIHKPDLGFFKEYVLTWPNVRLPANPLAESVMIDLSDGEDDAKRVASQEEELKVLPGPALDVADSDEDDPERLREDAEDLPPMPPCRDLEPTEAEMDACEKAKRAAAKALEKGQERRALELYTEAVMSGGAGALLFAKRAELLLNLRRPRAAIADCSAALEVNPDCGKAFRIRGVAQRKLGLWQAAQRDLTQGQKLDYDDSIVELQKVVDERCKQLAKKAKKKRGREPPSKKAKTL
mmetsp:Transcript_48355/g.87428  ORF Transcript_48355/g.87428 Transcript_48355/m.87428 type:complete len:258 (-) Transcript_48355:113-886(-)